MKFDSKKCVEILSKYFDSKYHKINAWNFINYLKKISLNIRKKIRLIRLKKNYRKISKYGTL